MLDDQEAGVTLTVMWYQGLDKTFCFFVLSRATYPAVLINTNGWHGYGELKSKIIKRVLDATNFVTRLRARYVGVAGPFTPRKPP